MSGRYVDCPCVHCEEWILPEGDRPQLCARAITMYAAEVGGLSNSQIAQILKFHQSTIAARVNAALLQLRKRASQ